MRAIGALALLVVVLIPTVYGILFLANRQTTTNIPTLAALPTSTVISTALPTFTLDAWALYGTEIALATASPTPDYCYWLTPSPTPLPTLPYTPDAWQLQGTAVFLTENPPQPPTPLPPRELCNNIPTIVPTAVFTPWPLPQLNSGQSQFDIVEATVSAAFAGPTATPEAFIISAPPVREIYRDVYIVVTATPGTP
jgi:hypothetical protein